MEGMFVDDLVLAAKVACGASSTTRDCSGATGDFGYRTSPPGAVVVAAMPTTSCPCPTRAAVAHLRDAELVLRPEESHLGGFAATHEVLGTCAKPSELERECPRQRPECVAVTLGGDRLAGHGVGQQRSAAVERQQRSSCRW